MNKSDLIKRMSDRLDELQTRDVDMAVHTMLELMSDRLATGSRVEIRGFGTFSNHYRQPRVVLGIGAESEEGVGMAGAR